MPAPKHGITDEYEDGKYVVCPGRKRRLYDKRGKQLRAVGWYCDGCLQLWWDSDQADDDLPPGFDPYEGM